MSDKTSDSLSRIDENVREGKKVQLRLESQVQDLQSVYSASTIKLQSEIRTGNASLKFDTSRLLKICASLRVQVQRIDNSQIRNMPILGAKQEKMTVMLEDCLDKTASMAISLRESRTFLRTAMNAMLELYVQNVRTCAAAKH